MAHTHGRPPPPCADERGASARRDALALWVSVRVCLGSVVYERRISSDAFRSKTWGFPDPFPTASNDGGNYLPKEFASSLVVRIHIGAAFRVFFFLDSKGHGVG